jgi:hypothetical protein
MRLRHTDMTVERLLLRQREVRTTADDCWHDAILTHIPDWLLILGTIPSYKLQPIALFFKIVSYAEINLNNGETRDYKLHKSVASYCETLYSACSLPYKA